MIRTWWLAVVVATALAGCEGSKQKFIDAGPIDAGRIDGGDLIDSGVDAAAGRSATGTVTGAVRAASPGYTLYGTLRGGDGSSSSPNYQRRSGLTGATQP